MQRRKFIKASVTAIAASTTLGTFQETGGATMKAGGNLIHSNVQFHNTSELVQVDGLPGLRLQRVPEQVRAKLNEQCQQRMQAPNGCEIRFVSQGKEVEVTLSSIAGPTDMIVFWGDFQDVERHTISAEPTTIKLTLPERIEQLKPGVVTSSAFPPHVWRLTMMGKDKHALLHFHQIKGEGLRPPHDQELPKQTYLAYGTSVTDGFGATAMHLTYIAQAARRLQADYINLGSAGSAYCEKEFADYMANRRDWTFATLEISLNMIGAEFTVEQYQDRAGYMTNTMAASDAARPVICITPQPYFGDLCNDVEGPHGKGMVVEYRKALRDVVKNSPHQNVHLIEGSDLVASAEGYTMDLAHPGDFGHAEIGARLAARIEKLIST